VPPNPTRRLIDAIEAGNLAAVRKAIGAGADLNVEWEDATPLMMAARAGRWSHGDTALSVAQSHEQRDVFWYLWTLADEDARRPATEDVEEDSGPPDQPPSLPEALRQGREDAALSLIRAGADPNRAPRGEAAPLIVAADRGYLEVLRALVEAGADLNRKDGSEDGWRILADAGARPDLGDGDGRTPDDIRRREVP
jgi:ankyrin repeat protein